MQGDRDEAVKRLEAFRSAVAGTAGTLVILGHDYPDPDCLGAAAAMQELLRRACDRPGIIAYGGDLGRPENRAMAGVLDIESVDLDTAQAGNPAGCVLVDTQPGSGNNSLPEDLPVVAVIDHHDPPPDPYEAAWVDVRAGAYGSTSTMLAEYFEAADLELDERLATALLLGLRTDTEDLERDAGPADVDAYVRLFGLANRQNMIQVMRPPLTEEYFGMLHRALDRARRWENAVVSNLGPVVSPDMLSEVSELFARLKGIELSLAVGVHEGRVCLSLRTRRPQRRLLELIRTIVGPEGRAGGHGRAVGGQLTPKDGDALGASEALCALFIESIGATEAGPRPVSIQGEDGATEEG